MPVARFWPAECLGEQALLCRDVAGHGPAGPSTARAHYDPSSAPAGTKERCREFESGAGGLSLGECLLLHLSQSVRQPVGRQAPAHQFRWVRLDLGGARALRWGGRSEGKPTLWACHPRRLLNMSCRHGTGIAFAKLRCLLAYFHAVTTSSVCPRAWRADRGVLVPHGAHASQCPLEC
jgi:hypothetical protein